MGVRGCLHIYVAKWHYATWGHGFHIYRQATAEGARELPLHIHSNFPSTLTITKNPITKRKTGLFIVGESAVIMLFNLVDLYENKKPTWL